jgi:predicted O-methyltransferase YrrM
VNVASLDYCPSLQRLVAEGKAQGLTGKVFGSLPAISTLNNLRILRHIIVNEKIASSLEIGLAFGGSALTILSTMREIHGNRPFTHTAIDPFQRTVWDSLALVLIEKEGVSQNFIHFDDYSSYVLPELARKKNKYGLIYVDGSHLFEDVFVDFYFVCDLLQTNGIVVFDDCTDKHVAKLIRFIQHNYSEILDEIGLDAFGTPPSFKQKLARLCGYRQARGFRKKPTNRRKWDAPFVSF